MVTVDNNSLGDLLGNNSRIASSNLNCLDTGDVSLGDSQSGLLSLSGHM